MRYVAGEHSSAYTSSHSERGGGRHVQRETLRAASEVRHDAGRAKRLRSVRRDLGASAFYTGQFNSLVFFFKSV